MGTATSTICAMAMLLVATAAARAQDAGSVVREGKHFRVVFHAGDLAEELAVVLADECAAAVEGFWPTLEKLLPVRVSKPGTIHVYRSEKEFRIAETKSPVRFPLEAFVGKDLEAHVWLHPPLSKQLLSAIGLPQPTLDDLRRVAAEQVVSPLAPSNDDQDWLRTVVVMGAVEAASNPRHLPGVDSAHDLRRTYVVDSRREGKQDTFEYLLRLDMTCVDRPGWDVRMAYCAYVAQVLAADESGWAKKLLGKQRELKGHVRAFDRRKVAVESVLGDDAAKNEARWQKQCKAMQPVWEMRSGTWVIGPKRSMLAGTESMSAVVSSVEPPPPGDYVISGRCELGVGDPQSDFRVEFGWDQKSLVGVFFKQDEVSIWIWPTASNRWIAKAQSKIESVADKPFDFRVEVTATEIRAFVDGTQRTVWAHGGREVHVHWGIGGNDRVVWLEGLKVGPLVPAKK